ncbi:MAG: glycosyltransferase [Spirochaetaceae bacterium]|nr:MAG: glycosyltransferase [Spirochaetaceae bacterium]
MILFLSSRIIFLLHVLTAVGTLAILALSLANILWLRSSGHKPASTDLGKVSVLIPARNEEANIRRCLDSLIEQSYPNYEIIVLDDLSEDRTWKIISEYALRYPGQVRAVRGAPLPLGWCGKTHAMQLLSQNATGDYLLFTDADTVHHRDSIAWAVTNINEHAADFLSGYVFQDLQSFGEALIVPTTYIMSTIVMPFWLIPRSNSSMLTMAVGQLVMFRRETFEAIGGYSSVAEQISEDVFVAREVKKAGYRTIFLDIREYVSCRMYEGYRNSFEGIGKNIYDFFKNQPAFFAAVTSILVAFIVLPFALVLIELYTGNPLLRFSAFSVLTFLMAWSLTLYDRGQKWWVPLLYPLTFVHLLYMAWKSFGRAAMEVGIVWKGRVFK